MPTFLALRMVPSGASVLGSTDLEDSTSVMRYATPDAAPAGSVMSATSAPNPGMERAMASAASAAPIGASPSGVCVPAEASV